MEARTQNATPVLMTIGLDIGKDVFHIVGFDADARRPAFGNSSSRIRNPHTRRAFEYLHLPAIEPQCFNGAKTLKKSIMQFPRS